MKRVKILSFLFGAFFLLSLASADATSIVFDDFSYISLLTLTIDAQTLSTSDGVVLRLTLEQTYSHSVSGSAFSSATINASKPLCMNSLSSIS